MPIHVPNYQFLMGLTNNASKKDYYEKCRVQMQTRCLIQTVKEEKIGQLKYIVMYISRHRLNHYKPVVSYCNYTFLRAKYQCETTFQNDIHFKHSFQFHNITKASCLKKCLKIEQDTSSLMCQIHLQSLLFKCNVHYNLPWNHLSLRGPVLVYCKFFTARSYSFVVRIYEGRVSFIIH